MVEFDEILVGVVGVRDLSLIDVVGGVCERQGPVDDVDRRRIEARGGDAVAGEGLAGDGVDDGFGDGRKIALPLSRGGHNGGIQERGGGLPETGVAAEDECLVMDDRPAKRSAELIAVQRRLSKRVPCVRVEVAVAEKLEERTMELIGARAGNHVDNSVSEAAELRAEVAGFNAELVQRVRIGHRVACVAEAGDVGAAVKVVVCGPHGGVRSAIDKRALGREAQCNGILRTLNARGKGQQGISVAVDEGKFTDLLAVDGLADYRVGGVDGGHAALDRNGGSGFADLEFCVDTRKLTYLQHDAGLPERTEPG